MKRNIYLSILLVATTVLPVIGKTISDTFNDNHINTSIWTLDTTLQGNLTEQSQKINYSGPTSPGGNNDEGHGAYLNANQKLPYNTNWTAIVKVGTTKDYTTLPSGSLMEIGFRLVNSDSINREDEIQFGFALANLPDTGGPARVLHAQCDSKIKQEAQEEIQLLNSNEVWIRLHWDAATQTMTSDYKIGNGNWSTLLTTPLSTGDTDWKMAQTSTFSLAIHAGNTVISTTLGEMYADDFSMDYIDPPHVPQVTFEDDFNDNTTNTYLWAMDQSPSAGTTLSEQNHQLEYAGPEGTSDDGNNVQWNLKHLLPFDRDWVTTLDGKITIPLTAMETNQVIDIGLEIGDANNGEDNIGFGFAIANMPGITSGATFGIFADIYKDDNQEGFALQNTTTNAVQLRLRWMASARLLACEFNTGSDWITVTNINISSEGLNWQMGEDSHFSIGINGYNEQHAVTAGQVVADNFKAVYQSGLAFLNDLSIAPNITTQQSEFSWQSAAGTTYHLETTTNLTNNVWVPATGPLSGTGGLQTFHLPILGTHAFFRGVAE